MQPQADVLTATTLYVSNTRNSLAWEAVERSRVRLLTNLCLDTDSAQQCLTPPPRLQQLLQAVI